MADTQPVVEAPSNGASQALAAREAARAATVAELEKLSDAPAAEAPSATTDAADAAGAGDVKKQTSSQDEAVESKAEPAKTEPDAEAKPDAETEKRLSAVQKAAKREREMIAKERADAKAEIDRMRAEVDAGLAQVKRFETLKARAKYDPAGVLSELGLTEDDFEPAARDIYARSKAAAADPKAKDAAIRMQREREANDKLSQLERKHAELEAKLAEKEQQAKYEQAWTGFLGDVGKTAETAEAPLMKAALAKNPTKTQQQIRQVCEQLYQETDEWPDPADVVATWEKLKRAELAELGIEAPAAKAAPKAAANTNTTAPTNGAPKTLGTDMAGGTQVSRAKKSLKEQREETDRLLESGKLE